MTEIKPGDVSSSILIAVPKHRALEGKSFVPVLVLSSILNPTTSRRTVSHPTCPCWSHSFAFVAGLSETEVTPNKEKRL